MPDAIYVTMMTQVVLRTREGLERLLNAFERVEEFTPTHWGPDERARNLYDRIEMLAAVSSFTDNFYVPGLHRRKMPRYEAYFSAKNPGLKDVKVEFGASLRKKDLARVFELGDALAEQLEPDFGFVHMIWRLGERSQRYSEAGITKSEELQECGPQAVCTRTWFGPHLVQLIGHYLLVTSGAPTKETTWDGICMDLVAEPWSSDFETLSSQQAKVMDHLRPSGVFGDYSESFKCKAGPNWTPIPEKDSD